MGRMHLYIDDSGSRQPDRKPPAERRDGMDWFGLGGILVREEDLGVLIGAHERLMARWAVEGPLHSTRIRGRRKTFAWLGSDTERETDFLFDLEETLLRIPVVGIACVIDRPGYVDRYGSKYPKPWLLCKTAFAILVERALKFARSHDCDLEVFFEEAGRTEDRAIQSYAKELKTEGLPFDPGNSQKYDSLTADDFRSTLVGYPNRITKSVPMAQFADLYLYPMAKGGYDPDYPPFAKLMQSGRLVDSALTAEERLRLGIKYSCFDGQTKQRPGQ